MASTIRISILADAANAVRGLRGTGAEAQRTARELASLQRQVARLDANSKVNIDIKTKGFAQGVGQIIVANLALDRIRKGLPDLSFGLTGIADKMALVAAGTLAATAATLPLVGAVTAVGAALGAAAVGVGLFAAVAAPTFKAVTTAVTEYNTASHAYDRAKAIGDTKAMTKAQQAMASSLGALTPMQRAAAQQTIAMNKAWSALSASQAPLVLGIISNAASTLGKILPKLTPAIDAIGKALKGISSTAFAGLSKSVTPFVNFVTNQGAPALKSMAGIIGTILVTVGHLATAFAPVGNQILSSLVPVTRAMRSINFDALAKSASDLLPLVGQLLSNLGGILSNLLKAVGPLVRPVLQMLTDIGAVLKKALGGPEIKTFVANIAKLVPYIAPIVGVLVTAFTKFAAIISGQLVALMPKLLPLVKQLADVFINVLTGLSPLLGPLLDLVGVFVSFLPVLYPLITAFREAMIPVVKAVGDALIRIRPSIGELVGAFTKLLGPVSDVLVVLIQAAPGLITSLVPAFIAMAGVVGGLLTAIKPLIPVVVKIIGSMAEGLTPVITAVSDALPGIGDAFLLLVPPLSDMFAALKPIYPVLGQIVKALLAGVKPIIEAVAGVMPQMVDAFKQLLPPILKLVPPLLQLIPPLAALAAQMITWIVPIMLQIVPVVVAVANVLGVVLTFAVGILVRGLDSLTKFIAKPSAAFATMRDNIVKIWNQIAGFTSRVFSSIGTFFVTIFGFIRDRFVGFINGVQAVWGGILSLVTRAIEFRDRVIGVVSELIQRFRDIAGNIIGGFIDGVRAGFDRVKGVFSDLTDKIASWKGPPARDAKLLTDNGKLIIGGLITGIGSQVPALKTQLAGVSSIIQGGVTAEASVALSTAAIAPLDTTLTASPTTDLTTTLAALVRVSGPLATLVTALTASMDKLTNAVTAAIAATGVSLAKFTNQLLANINALVGNLARFSGTVAASGQASLFAGRSMASSTASINRLTGVMSTSAQASAALARANALGTVPIVTGAGQATAPGIAITVNVTPGADPAEAGRQVVLAIEAYERRTGRRRLVAA